MFEWQSGSRFRVDASKAGEEIARIELEHGCASPEMIVEESRPKRAVLHGEFEWDDSTAAQEHRKYQARKLVNSLVLVSEKLPKAPAFHSVHILDGTRGYVASTRVMSEEEMREEALKDARAQIRGWRTRYGHMKEFAALVAVIDRLD